MKTKKTETPKGKNVFDGREVTGYRDTGDGIVFETAEKLHISPQRPRETDLGYQRRIAEHTPVYCHEIKYLDGDTLSVSAVKSKPRETIHMLLTFKSQNADLLAALKELFKQCSMVHKYWGKIDNSRKADAAIEAAQAAIQKAEN